MKGNHVMKILIAGTLPIFAQVDRLQSLVEIALPKEAMVGHAQGILIVV